MPRWTVDEDERFSWNKKTYKLLQSNIHQALWTIVEDDESRFLHEMKKVGYVLTYVDDFMIVAENHFEDSSRRRFRVTGRSRSRDLLIKTEVSEV